MIFSRELSVNGNKVYIKVCPDEYLVNTGREQSAANFILDNYNALTTHRKNFVFPKHDTEIIFEFGTDPEIYDCSFGVNFERANSNRFIVECNTNDFLEKLEGKQYEKWNNKKTALFNLLVHEIQHVKDGWKVKPFYNDIDNAAETGKITWNDNYQLVISSDMQVEGTAESVECFPWRPYWITRKAMAHFRKNYELIQKIEPKDSIDYKKTIDKYYEEKIRINGIKTPMHDVYAISNIVFNFIAAANDADVFDCNMNVIKKEKIWHELSESNPVIIIPDWETFMKTYEMIDSVNHIDFLEIYEDAADLLGIPENMMPTDIKQTKKLLSKIKN